MRIAISGSHGLIGTGLLGALQAEHEFFRLRREGPGYRLTALDDEAEVPWSALAGGAVINLAGRSLGCLWTPANRREIRHSRVDRTHWLAECLAALPEPPAVLLSASGVGYYGDRGEAPLSENAAPGRTFLADLCRDWEAACAPAVAAGVRVVNLRLGMVLSRAGGALQTMLPIFRKGLGGRLGSGKQYLSWIAEDDVWGVVRFLLATPEVTGPVNVCSPHPVTNLVFTKALGRALLRPTVLPVPSWLLLLLPGDMGPELFQSSIRAVPRVLEKSEMHFAYRDLDRALAALLREV